MIGINDQSDREYARIDDPTDPNVLGATDRPLEGTAQKHRSTIGCKQGPAPS
jgi:hypothetical protein